jgi:hypothetical protein
MLRGIALVAERSAFTLLLEHAALAPRREMPVLATLKT